MRPGALGLSGAPAPEPLADALLALAEAEGARLLLLDGPQGWRAGDSPHPHARACEREARTPGKTGLPGIVKPRSWTRFAEFSVALFDALSVRGWPRLGPAWRGERAAIESFPTHAWRALGHRALPGKRAGLDVAPWRAILEGTHGVSGVADASHDELQAVVAGLAGLQLVARGLAAAHVLGAPPVLEAGVWREGFIVSPSPERSP